jgi:hypothetical protein
VRLAFWDTGSQAQQQYQHIKSEVGKGVDVVLYVCASSEHSSFKFIQRELDKAGEKVPYARIAVVTK